MTTATVAPPAYAAVPRLWPGETFVCIGGGSSLTREDVEYCRGKARIVAVKEAIQLAPWAEVLYACDVKWLQWYKGAPEFKGLKFTIEQKAGEPYPGIEKYPGWQVLRNTGDEGLELEPTGLRTGSNSGYQAINLAVHLGAARIILLGYDMWRGPTGQQNWFGAHPAHIASPYPVFLQRFASIGEPLRAAGVEVLNCSRFTVMTTFPRVPLEEAL